MAPITDNYYGIVLAAGFGTRMKPLTDHIPKPLIEFMGVPTLMLSLAQFKHLGIESVGINAHHNAELIKIFADSNPFNQDIYVSVEQDKILGSGGSFPSFNSIRKRKSIIALNGDVISDLNIQVLIAKHEEKNAQASMALLPFLNEKGNSVWVNSDNQIVGICPQKPEGAVKGGTFSGIQMLSDDFVNQIPSGVESNILDFYKHPNMMGTKVYAHFFECFWHDVGNPADFIKAHKDYESFYQSSHVMPDIGIKICHQVLGINEVKFYNKKTTLSNNVLINPPCLIIGEPKIGMESELGPHVLISSNVEIGQNSKIEHSYLINGATIENHSKINGVIKTKYDELQT